jgi:hypothetical protein
LLSLEARRPKLLFCLTERRGLENTVQTVSKNNFLLCATVGFSLEDPMYTPTNFTHHGWHVFIECETEGAGPGKAPTYRFRAWAEYPLPAAERHGDTPPRRIDLAPDQQTVYADRNAGEAAIRTRIREQIDVALKS